MGLRRHEVSVPLRRRHSSQRSRLLHHGVPDAIKELIHAVEHNDSPRLNRAMARVIQSAADVGLPKSFLMDIQHGLQCGDWSRFADGFRRAKFLGKDGRFLLVAPYTTSRGGKVEAQLSAIYGAQLNLASIPPSDEALINLFGELREPIPHMLPFQAYAAAGWFTGEAGEAFIVPNGWAGLPQGDGPALNNVSEQLLRVGRGATEAIRRIFDAPSAALLLSAYAPRSRLMTILNQEYLFHEAGHASGLGISHKFAAGVLNSPFLGAVEEWRADGVGFELARMLLPAEMAGTVIASNLITRFGIDAHRKGTIDFDTDANSALLTFQFLLEAGAIRIHEGNRLGFAELSFTSLVHATALMRTSALALTREEMRLSTPRGIGRLYPDALAVSEGTRQLFQQMVVAPCAGLYRELR